MQIKITLTLTFLLLVGANFVAFGQNFDTLGQPRFIVQGTFGLELVSSANDTHRIATYLPHTSIIYFHPSYSEAEKIGSNMYRAVVTQYGQRLWVWNENVANSTFSGWYGQQNVIFHQDGYICPSLESIPCDDTSGYEINRGDVLETVAEETTYYHLRAYERASSGNSPPRTREGLFDPWAISGV